MRISWGIALFCGLWLGLPAAPAWAQFHAPADLLQMQAFRAFTWQQDGAHVIQLEEDVVIELGDHRMTAHGAVVWLSPDRRGIAGERYVEIALVGEARIVHRQQAARSGPLLLVDAFVRGDVRLLAQQRIANNRSDSELYRVAEALHRSAQIPEGLLPPLPEELPAEEEPPVAPALPRGLPPVRISAGQIETIETPDGIAAVLTGNIVLIHRGPDGSLVELMAQRAVVFTPLRRLTDIPAGERAGRIEESVTAAYLEGDVRLVRTPAAAGLAEQRLQASRLYYEFTTDRAVLTDVVLHTVDPERQIPIIVRARTVRQLSDREYSIERAELSTSSFHTPTYSIRASSAYVRQVDTGDPFYGMQTRFTASDATLRVGGLPVFWLPWAGGSMAERSALRDLDIVSSKTFGWGVATRWGLFESAGRLPPPGLDMSYRLDYFHDRGPATGLDGRYTGGFVSETTLQPWTFDGNFTSYLIHDKGTDRLGRRRIRVEPERELRGRFYGQHQHYLPDDWQLQLTASYISDPTFLEQWYPEDFRTSAPLETSLYIKRLRDSEAVTFLASLHLNDFPTTAEVYQEQFQIERMPELGYHRIGDSLLSDELTWFSSNTVTRARFQQYDGRLQDIGFRRNMHPGLPSVGFTGAPESWTWRGDFRQELNWPADMGRFRVVPYVVGRWTGWTNSVDGGSIDRWYGGGGVRIATAFWRVDDTIRSELLDLHRLRHVVEPQVHLYGGAQTTHRTEVLIYDEQIDAIHDIAAVQLALRQRWQTQRGGPGRWRSVDVLTLNLEYNHFFRQPPDEQLQPIDFRGRFFPGIPEASIPRTGINADALWRLSDSFEIFADGQYNLDERTLATAGAGIRVRHLPRVAWSLGYRHVGIEYEQEIGRHTFNFEKQHLLSFAIDYELTSKYVLGFSHAYDFAQSRHVRSTAALIRRFDRFFAAVTVRLDRIEDDDAIMFNLWAEGLQEGPMRATPRQMLE